MKFLTSAPNFRGSAHLIPLAPLTRPSRAPWKGSEKLDAAGAWGGWIKSASTEWCHPTASTVLAENSVTGWSRVGHGSIFSRPNTIQSMDGSNPCPTLSWSAHACSISYRTATVFFRSFFVSVDVNHTTTAAARSLNIEKASDGRRKRLITERGATRATTMTTSAPKFVYIYTRSGADRRTMTRRKAQIPLGSSRHVSTRHVRRVERVETACRAVLFGKLDTAKMRGLDTSNVSCRVETSHDEPSGIRA